MSVYVPVELKRKVRGYLTMALLVKRYRGMGKGVYSTLPFVRGDVVDVTYVIPLTAKDWKAIKESKLETYVYAWGKNGRYVAMPVGYGGLFNHSDEPNMCFWLDHRRECITFRATRDIVAGEQLTIDYRWSKKDKVKFLNYPSC